MVARYYRVLRSIVRARPHLKNCLTSCKHCHILFLTHPRNAGRTDLSCAFGCRQAHRKKGAIRRSIEYYQSSEGRVKKRHLNARRHNQHGPPESKPEKKTTGDQKVFVVDGTTLFHIKTVTSLIEGRSVSIDDIAKMITKIMRQLSIDKRKKFAYVDPYYRKIPP